MQRITITLEDELLETIDSRARERGYSSRSEAIRDLVRETITRDQPAGSRGDCVAAFTYAYDHHVRDLANRLTHAQHDHHELMISTMHVHLDHETCLEVALMRGRYPAVQEFADAVSSQRGVKHAHLHVIPARISKRRHGRHAPGHHEHVSVE
ncbi:MAG: nickel-responsive transcriptional regulator NikR [Hyphomonadaceae bacterium]|nr:nickel-responsive transcriptional regulator NikR [Hyphomonadaceae bacterium]